MRPSKEEEECLSIKMDNRTKTKIGKFKLKQKLPSLQHPTIKNSETTFSHRSILIRNSSTSVDDRMALMQPPTNVIMSLETSPLKTPTPVMQMSGPLEWQPWGPTSPDYSQVGNSKNNSLHEKTKLMIANFLTKL